MHSNRAKRKQTKRKDRSTKEMFNIIKKFCPKKKK